MIKTQAIKKNRLKIESIFLFRISKQNQTKLFDEC